MIKNFETYIKEKFDYRKQKQKKYDDIKSLFEVDEGDVIYYCEMKGRNIIYPTYEKIKSFKIKTYKREHHQIYITGDDVNIILSDFSVYRSDGKDMSIADCNVNKKLGVVCTDFDLLNDYINSGMISADAFMNNIANKKRIFYY